MKPPLLVKFTHKNLPDRIKQFNGNKLRINHKGQVYLDDRSIADYTHGWDGEYFKVWDNETFYSAFSDMEVTVDAIPS